jgi:hypothetical protein
VGSTRISGCSLRGSSSSTGAHSGCRAGGLSTMYGAGRYCRGHGHHSRR